MRRTGGEKPATVVAITWLLAMLWGAAGAQQFARPAGAGPEAPSPAAGQAVPFEMRPVEGGREFPRHAGRYPDLRVIWREDRTVDGALAVYPHEVFADRVALVTEAGLMLSGDAGRSWQPVQAASAERIGRITQVAFAPDDPNRFYLATSERGVHGSADGGRTLRRLGGPDAGLVSDEVAGVCFYPGDLAFGTLLACHGDAARGISRSTDGGTSWEPIARDYHVHLLVPGRPGRSELHMVAAGIERPGVRNIYHSFAPSNYWNEVAGDVVVTSAARAVLEDAVYFATGRRGLLRVSRAGGLCEELKPRGLEELASVDVTWGHNADEQVVVAYEPRSEGLVALATGASAATASSRGLFTGPFVRPGAQIKACATGRVLLAVANGTCYRGVRAGGRVAVHGARVSPNPFSFLAQTYEDSTQQIAARLGHFSRRRRLGQAARDLLTYVRELERSYAPVELVVSARVSVRGGAPRAVSVDLSRLGLSPTTPMYDDGAHGDEAAADGVYAARFSARPDRLRASRYDWRRPWPGVVGLTVSAIGPDGGLAGEVAPLQLLSRPGTITFWEEHSLRSHDPRTRYGLGDANLAIAPAGGHGAGGDCLVVDVAGTGPWRLPIGRDHPNYNLVGYHAVGFYLRASGATRQDLRVALQDVPSYVAATVTPPVSLRSIGEVGKEGPPSEEYLHVIVPLDRLLADAGAFQTNRVGWLVLSGPGERPVRYYLDGIRFYRSAEDAQAERALIEAAREAARTAAAGTPGDEEAGAGVEGDVRP